MTLANFILNRYSWTCNADIRLRAVSLKSATRFHRCMRSIKYLFSGGQESARIIACNSEPTSGKAVNMNQMREDHISRTGRLLKP